MINCIVTVKNKQGMRFSNQMPCSHLIDDTF